jgi:hypothetical protein
MLSRHTKKASLTAGKTALLKTTFYENKNLQTQTDHL